MWRVMLIVILLFTIVSCESYDDQIARRGEYYQSKIEYFIDQQGNCFAFILGYDILGLTFIPKENCPIK